MDIDIGKDIYSVALSLAASAREPKLPGSSWMLAMCSGELSAVITWIRSKCL